MHWPGFRVGLFLVWYVFKQDRLFVFRNSFCFFMGDYMWLIIISRDAAVLVGVGLACGLYPVVLSSLLAGRFCWACLVACCLV